MAKNYQQLFPGGSDTQWTATPVVAANTTRVGNAGTTYTVYTAGADGGYVTKFTIQPLGTNSQKTVMRLFEVKAAPSTAADYSLIAEWDIPTSVASEDAAVAAVEKNFLYMVKAAYSLIVTIGTAGGAGWQVTAFGQTFTV